MKNKFCRKILSFLLMTMLALHLTAQQKPLKIGDAIPPSLWSSPLQIVNAPQKTMSLSDDQNKLVLIDFWATWCGSCLRNFPKMEELEKHFGDRLKILTVTSQKRADVEKFFASTNGKRYRNTVSVTDDKIVHELFPHRGVPYVVWIKNGKLLNTTDADQVTEKSISEILNNQASSLETVNLMEKNRPAMLSNIFDTEKNTAILGYTFISKGRIRALDYGTWFHRSGGKTYGRQFTNLSLLDIYEALSYELFRQHGDNFSIKRIVNLVKNPEDIEVNTKTEDKETDSRLYTIDYLVPKAESDSLYSRMLRVINENTEFQASIQKKPTQCLVLKRSSNKDKIATKGGIFTDAILKNPSILQNAILDYMISPLNANNEITSLPVIDETGYKGKVDLRFSNLKDLKTLQKELSVYDLTLEETERNLLMLVIKDKKQ